LTKILYDISICKGNRTFDEKIMDISKFVRNFERAIPGETIFRYDVFPLSDRIGTMYPSWISREKIRTTV